MIVSTSLRNAGFRRKSVSPGPATRIPTSLNSSLALPNSQSYPTSLWIMLMPVCWIVSIHGRPGVPLKPKRSVVHRLFLLRLPITYPKSVSHCSNCSLGWSFLPIQLGLECCPMLWGTKQISTFQQQKYKGGKCIMGMNESVFSFLHFSHLSPLPSIPRSLLPFLSPSLLASLHL